MNMLYEIYRDFEMVIWKNIYLPHRIVFYEKMRITKLFLILLLIANLFPSLVPSQNVEALDISISAVKGRDSDMYSPETVWDMGYTGKGVNIAVIDSGIDDDHPDLQGKFIAGVDLTQLESPVAPRDGSYNPDDNDGHGTACTGCVMANGTDSDGIYKGSAPAAGLVDIKVTRGLEHGAYTSRIIKGGNEVFDTAFDWAIDHKEEFNIRIISISLGTPPENSNGTGERSLAVKRAVESGIVVISAAGNEGPDNEGFYGSDGADEIITVGATDDYNTITRKDDKIAFFSSVGPRANDGDENPYDELKPDVVAPGVDINTLRNSFTSAPPSGYSEVSGTSFSCPIVAGVVALMLEANPDLTPAGVKNILHIIAEQRGTPNYPNYPYPHNKWNRSYGYGIIDAYEAVKMAVEYNNELLDTPVLNPIQSPNWDGNYRISWSNIEEAQWYSLLEANNSEFNDFFQYSNINDAFFDFVHKENGQYYYKVMANSNSSYSKYSNIISITVEKSNVYLDETPVFITYPEKPDYDGNFELEWTPVDGADRYLLQIDENKFFSTVSDVYNGSKTNYREKEREPGNYYYRVKGYKSDMESHWSELLKIMVIEGYGLDTPVLSIEKSKENTHEYTVSWSQITGATKYELHESEDEQFKTFIIKYRGQDTEILINKINPETHYYRVKAINEDTESQWSTTDHFTIEIQEEDQIKLDEEEVEVDDDDASPGFGINIIILAISVLLLLMSQNKRKR